MPTTVYDRLAIFYEQKNVTPLTYIEKPMFGRVVAAHWKRLPEKSQTDKIYSVEDTGTYKAVVYPDYFAQEIDKMIREWYYPTPKKVRNRKPMKPGLAFSVKPSKT